MNELSLESNNRTIYWVWPLYWLWPLLLLAIVVSALTIVRGEHRLNTGYLEINQLASEADAHLLQYARLLAEKDALMNPYRVGMEAVEKFDMLVPPASKIQVLR